MKIDIGKYVYINGMKCEVIKCDKNNIEIKVPITGIDNGYYNSRKDIDKELEKRMHKERNGEVEELAREYFNEIEKSTKDVEVGLLQQKVNLLERLVLDMILELKSKE